MLRFRQILTLPKHATPILRSLARRNIADHLAPPPSGVRMVAFAGVFCSGAFLAASAYDYRRMRRGVPIFGDLSWNSLFKESPKNKFDELVKRAQVKWRLASPGERVIIPLIGVNLAVFLSFRIPGLRSFMARHFIHTATSPAHVLLTSAFSHMHPLHLTFNMVALYSFGVHVAHSLGTAQFLAFYLSSGVLASLGSHLWRRGLIGWSSLGASGAVYAVFALSAVENPNMRVGMILLPNVHIPADVALNCAMGLDALGVVFRWGVLDHVAHLSGAVCGLVYHRLGDVLYANLMKMWYKSGLLD